MINLENEVKEKIVRVSHCPVQGTCYEIKPYGYDAKFVEEPVKVVKKEKPFAKFR